MKGIKKYLKDNLGIILALVAMILFLYVYPKTHNTFLTTNNIFNVLRQSATNLMLACGMTMVIILGGIDLSVGSIIAMSGVLGAAAVVWHGLPEIVGILIAILSGLLFGGFNTIMYALAGGVLSMVCMSLLSRVKGMHPITVSMAGGVAHNVGQVALAMVILQTPQLLYYMAVLMLVGLACGALTGVVASSVMKHLKTIK